ncbi:MAG: FRG domain-containing protein [Ignavibacterium sp.]
MYYKIFIKDWDEIKTISRNNYHFIFRGHTQRDWKLKPTLERAADKFLMDYTNLFSHEYLVFRAFKSVAHNYLIHVPEERNFIEWMAILQHYGAPTRLLDFTYSIYIAAFFAFEQAIDDSAIWALNIYKINEFLLNKLESDRKWRMRNLVLHDYEIEIANKLLDYENEGLVKSTKEKFLENRNIIFSVSPDNKNERLAIQNSVFLMPSDLEESFESILIKQFDLKIDNLFEENAIEVSFEDFINNKFNYDTCIFKLIVPRRICVDGLYDLRNMNINASTLFPGLDGQARSLNLLIRNLEGIALDISDKK